MPRLEHVTCPFIVYFRLIPGLSRRFVVSAETIVFYNLINRVMDVEFCSPLYVETACTLSFKNIQIHSYKYLNL